MQRTTTRPARKPLERTVSLTRHGEWFRLEITQQRSRCRCTVDYYLVQRIPAAFGVGFQLEKEDVATEEPVEVYDINLGGLDGYSTCDCRGFGAHGHCRHVEALAKLIAGGKLPCQPDNMPTDEAAFWRDMGYEQGLVDGAERWALPIGEPETAA